MLLRSYLEWGTGMVDRLNGMYAFAIWDARSEELLLVRDRMGVKPLYYFPTQHGVLFGSEPKAILANPLVSPRVNVDGLRELLDMVKTPEALFAQGSGPVRSFSVDFAGAAENFVPDPLRATPDAPYVRDLAQHVSAAHTEVLLDSDDLSDPVIRAAVLAATDLPPNCYGDLWPSLYLLFRSIREHSTVALSGE